MCSAAKLQKADETKLNPFSLFLSVCLSLPSFLSPSFFLSPLLSFSPSFLPPSIPPSLPLSLLFLFLWTIYCGFCLNEISKGKNSLAQGCFQMIS
jgi:hypothetical protein